MSVKVEKYDMHRDIDLKEIDDYLDEDMKKNIERECPFYKGWEQDSMYATTEDSYLVDQDILNKVFKDPF